jgi:hypothetical protein
VDAASPSDLGLGHVLGTATCISPFLAHTAARPVENQDHKYWKFPLVRDTSLRLQSVGWLGLEPRTGGL